MASPSPFVEHVVLFKLKADAPANAEEIVVQELRSLSHRVPLVVDISAGSNVAKSGPLYAGYSDRTRGFHICLVVRLKNVEDIENYSKHEEHVKVVQAIKPYVALEEALAFDYIH
eukprot:TRINITY_DN16229_c0_g1::TRINITY_DN16229_c0_g1_i1::g.3111::m.3111 TRINITY_DN16229_c0_g1::TRINITY_DN16229_c0_g1_i1::g.3111  ORF type:complete len:115 (+),score=13.36,Dabb/PF07876.7/8.8e-19,DUF4188/PF13826.1/0.091 TRINITY_DN16229_c0_g1_i1:60-404(+)